MTQNTATATGTAAAYAEQRAAAESARRGSATALAATRRALETGDQVLAAGWAVRAARSAESAVVAHAAAVAINGDDTHPAPRAAAAAMANAATAARLVADALAAVD